MSRKTTQPTKRTRKGGDHATVTDAQAAVPKSPVGRPSLYRDEYPRLAREACEQFGATIPQLAALFAVHPDTISEWMSAHPEFSDAVKAGRAISDELVERRLFERATGYSHADTHISNFQGSITVTPVTKHYPPDPASAIFWLKNRKPKDWREKVEHEHGLTDDFAAILANARKRRTAA